MAKYRILNICVSENIINARVIPLDKAIHFDYSPVDMPLRANGQEYRLFFPIFKTCEDAFECLNLTLPELDNESKCFFSLIYSMQPKKSQPQEELNKERDMSVVYVIENENKLTKIGITKRTKKRFSNIQSSSGYKIINCFYTKDMQTDLARKTKRALHKYFSNNKKLGDWFNISFSIAKDMLIKL